MQTTLRRFYAFLAVWAIVILTIFVKINFFGGEGDEFQGFWQLWHRYYFGPLFSTILIVPLVLFVRPIARGYGGWRTAIGASCWALALGACAFGIGNGVWFYYNTCADWAGSLACSSSAEVPYPSWADAGYLLLLPLVLTGLVRLSKVLGFRKRDLLSVVALFVVIAIPTAYLTWEFTIGSETYGHAWQYNPDYPGFLDAIGTILQGDGTRDTLFNVVSGVYVIFDIVLLSMAVTLLVLARRVAGGQFFLPVLSTALALIFQYTADMAFFKRVANGSQHTGDYSDLLYWIAMFLLMATVALFGRAIVRLTNAVPAAAAPASTERTV